MEEKAADETDTNWRGELQRRQKRKADRQRWFRFNQVESEQAVFLNLHCAQIKQTPQKEHRLQLSFNCSTWQEEEEVEMEDKQGVGAKSEEAGAEDEQGQPEAASKCFEAA